MAEIGLHGMDPPDPAERLQRAGEIGATHGGAHAFNSLTQRLHVELRERGQARAIDDRRFVQMVTAFGGGRIVDWLSGEQLPRIC